ncbi:MAG TPA: A/G-specific adenine glycosylase [Gammaproteobacteria bacterium]|nr:A/G-specific adenine glycosylase [Gammaproteobacteria bacterium]
MHPFAEDLLDWFQRRGRTLPWRGLDDPYPIWISEIMLQQTRVETVMPYYRRFLERFPDLRTLADAREDEVLALWSGLGYYSRARNLHAAARRIRDEHGGVFPRELPSLVDLPGIGPSTAGAILSSAFNLPLSILDANVKRVLARVTVEREFPGRSPVERRLWERARERTPAGNARDYNQAIMDLGATLCTRSRPQCRACPVQRHCGAYAEGLAEELPVRPPRKDKPVREVWFPLVESELGLLLERRPPTGFWGGLWCPPLVDLEDCTPEQACAMLEERLGGRLQWRERLPVFRHTFTHFHLDLHPLRLAWSGEPKLADAEHVWAVPGDRERLGLPAAVAPWLQTAP